MKLNTPTMPVFVVSLVLAVRAYRRSRIATIVQCV